MHPDFSSFPNSHFNLSQILDALHGKHYLQGKMFGPYSFTNVANGREELVDDGQSLRNMVEVAVVMKILEKCYGAWLHSKENISIGIMSPYAAQVVAIQEKIGQKYDRDDGFDVHVKSIEGFQGGEHDIVILSTARTSDNTSPEFFSDPHRTKVALTRARHCLWILGDEKALTNEENVWKALVLDAKSRKCVINAVEDEDLAEAICNAKDELDQLDDLLNADSYLFQDSKWKVLFGENFLKSFRKLPSVRAKRSAINLLQNLSKGKIPKRNKLNLASGNLSKLLKAFKIEGLYVICSIDILKESRYTQALKIWDILPQEDIPKLVKQLGTIFESYTDDFINRCNEKCLEGNMEIPMSWERSVEIIKFKNPDDGRTYADNSKVRESLLLMKFYSSSPDVVSHLLSDYDNNELDVPFEVTDEERDIILFPRSTFVLGRSGTGKTTVLTTKLIQKEKLHHMSNQAVYGSDNAAVPSLDQAKKSDRPLLRQLFVTVSPTLCQAVKQDVDRLKRSICGGNVSAESRVPGSFIDLPANSFPLVITFQDFLMMLDGSVGNSYFERFINLYSHEPRSVALENIIAEKEVTYDRFHSSYWPYFHSSITKKLDPSRVFTEILSHIKGGIQALEDGKLTRDGYLSLCGNRTSSLTKKERELIYDIYFRYEKLKLDREEFDVADIVNDLHRRLKIERYIGDEIQYVYIDEVQDLSMIQIALFRYICHNIEEGFVFCGDTAQTIAKGIDFRFEDIKNLFYTKFFQGSQRVKDRGKISDLFVLSQNFRTHDAVLKLSQSIIELLLHFFPNSVDMLKQESSLICGEAPIVLEGGNRKSAITTIFRDGEFVDGKIVGFGAQQVILVRDDSARKEVLDYVGKQALVLTILECKGLEFQDVLLYNFFGSSPLESRWRLIYGYMMKQGMLEFEEDRSYPRFNNSKHYIFCSELKQLYVAITRTRQRLWICENKNEFSKPAIDYWKKRGLVQVKELDDTLAQEMKVASSPLAWQSRGIELYHQHNYEMATMCFEKAGDSYWERKSKAAGLRAAANRLSDLHHEDANKTLREAAQIFEEIGMIDIAAQCFSDLGDQERAGKLYLEKYEQPNLKRAGDCFYVAGSYEMAAQVYARGSFFSDCLTACIKGGLFGIGLDYIQRWKQNETAGHEQHKIEQKLLESCAKKYFDQKDIGSMMKFVSAFHSIDLKREFLMSLNLLDELLMLEEESGNFTEAANIARLMGDTLGEVDRLGNASKFMEAFEVLLSYILANSLWSSGGKGWPIKPFAQKVDLLTRALYFAEQESSSFYVLASTECEILSNDNSDIVSIMNHLKSSRTYASIRGEILCLWKLLDAHSQLNSSKYVWKDNVIVDSVEEMIMKNQLSVETLFHCWTCWKDSIVQILEYLPRLESRDVQQVSSYGQFALNYLGIQKHVAYPNVDYHLLIPDANWVTKIGDGFLKSNGRLVCVDVHLLVSAARDYWSSELLSVGMNVLHNLDALYKFSAKKAISSTCQIRCLMLVYEVSKYLIESKCFSHNYGNSKALERFLKLPLDNFFGYVVPIDCTKALSKSMVSFRATDAFQNFVKMIIFENIRGEDKLTCRQIGTVVVMFLGTATSKDELCLKIMKRFYDNLPWRVFIQCLDGDPAFKETNSMVKFYEALKETCKENWMKKVDSISPRCFVYLIERLVLMISRWQGLIFASQSSFVEWLIYHDGDNFLADWSWTRDTHEEIMSIEDFILDVLHQVLRNVSDTKDWIRRSEGNGKHYFPLFVLRLVVLMCTLNLSCGSARCFHLLNELLNKSHITKQLPTEFFQVLQKGKKSLNLEVIAKAFKKIDNPLIIVMLRAKSRKILCPDAVFLTIQMCQRIEDALEVLFPSVDLDTVETAQVTSEASDGGLKYEMNVNCFWDILENLRAAVDASDLNVVLHNSLMVKDFLGLISSKAASLPQIPVHLEDRNEGEVKSLLDEVKQLSAALSVGDSLTENNIPIIGELSKKILSRRLKVDHVLNQLFLLHKNTTVECEAKQSKPKKKKVGRKKGRK